MRGVREVARDRRKTACQRAREARTTYRFVRSHLLVADEDSPEACPYEVVQSCKYNL